MTSQITETLLVVSISLIVMGTFVAALLMVVLRESRRKEHYDDARHRADLEVIRKSLEEQLYKINDRLTATEERWRDVNHLLISAQKSAPQLEAQPARPTSRFLDSAGIQNAEVDTKLVFVLTPFHGEFAGTYETISSVCQSIGLRCLRGDEEHIRGDIFRHILELIVSARLVVANLDGRNPNVYYELGVAHALGKPVLMVASSTAKVPFDVSASRIIFWENPQQLRERLREELLKVFVGLE